MYCTWLRGGAWWKKAQGCASNSRCTPTPDGKLQDGDDTAVRRATNYGVRVVDDFLLRKKKKEETGEESRLHHVHTCTCTVSTVHVHSFIIIILSKVPPPCTSVDETMTTMKYKLAGARTNRSMLSVCAHFYFHVHVFCMYQVCTCTATEQWMMYTVQHLINTHLSKISKMQEAWRTDASPRSVCPPAPIWCLD